MPELPEVETIRRGLQATITKKKVVSVLVKKPKQIKNNLSEFRSKILGNSFIKISRIGKLLIFELEKGDDFLLVHLKMTGQLIYVYKNKFVAGGHNLPLTERLPNKYSHIILRFADGSQLFYNDLRQFGYFKIVHHLVKKEIVGKYGLEPLTRDFTWENFSKILVKKTGNIKSILLNQQIFSGIGNIYADEICFRSGVLPSRRINTLSKKELRKIYLACQYIIDKAVKMGGTTFSDYRTADGSHGNFVKYLKVYGRDKKRCLKCKKVFILKKKIAGRGTHFCTNCQK